MARRAVNSPFLRLDAEDAGVGLLERGKDFGRRDKQRSRGQGLDRQARGHGAALGQRAVQARRYLAARPVGDERDALAGLDRKARLDGVARAWQQIGRRWTENHPDYCSRACARTLAARSLMTRTAMLVSRTSRSDPRTRAATPIVPAPTAAISSTITATQGRSAPAPHRAAPPAWTKRSRPGRSRSSAAHAAASSFALLWPTALSAGARTPAGCRRQWTPGRLRSASSWRASSRARSTARARRLLVLMARTDEALVRMAGATIIENAANGLAGSIARF